jgi:nitrogen-specific signal transduction histidine kinase
MLTDKEIKKIAKIVATEVIETFIREYSSEIKVDPVDETDLIVMELDRLNKLMSRYVLDEQYEKATIIQLIHHLPILLLLIRYRRLVNPNTFTLLRMIMEFIKTN